MAKSAPSDYMQMINPQGYVNNREITNLPGNFLVVGSRNCIIVTKDRVASRLGMKLVGDTKTTNKGFHSSTDWQTSGDGAGQVVRNIRLCDNGDMEVWYKGEWVLFHEHTAGTVVEFIPWWDATEKIDQLLWVNGTDKIHSWSGGIAIIASTTATTITMKYNVTGSTIAFNNNGAAPDTITDSANGFVVADFQIGDTIFVEGSASNDGIYIVDTVTAGVLTLNPNDSLTTEAAGASVVVKRPGATWADSRFLNIRTRKVYINGTEYAYTGGETTNTLTGLSGVSGVIAGDYAVQAVIIASPAHLTGRHLDLISVMNNYIFYGSKRSRAFTISSDTDYTNFSFTIPLRKPSEGFDMEIDSTPTAFVPDEDFMWISGRKDDWYKVLFTLSADQGAETITIKKLKTATGQGAQSQAVVVNMKNGVAFLSFEPTIDTLSNIPLLPSQMTVPISYEIRNDVLAYNWKGAHGLFYQNQIIYTLPKEGVVLIRNTQDSIWQPPQYMNIGRLALIDINGDGTQVLCGHSASSNETYQIFAPNTYNDNGAPIDVEMRFGYDNYGTRFTQKVVEEFALELYMSANTIVKDECVYDYRGATDIRDFTIRGDDEIIRFEPRQGGGFGENEMGSQPLGSLATAIDDLSKIRVVNMTSPLDFFERQRVFRSQSLDGRFVIIAYGEDVEISENIPAFIKR